MKIVVLGAAGQLGRELCRVLPGEVIGLTRSDAEVTDAIALRRVLDAARPRVVVNAAGWTQVDAAESEPGRAFAVNALAVRDLASICRDLDAAVIHFSSDYVFGLDVTRDAPYDEDDPPGPLNVYGSSKLAGELFLRALWPKHFIIRTCGLYGKGGANFVEAMLRKIEEGTPPRVVADQICTPTSAADLARAIIELLESEAFGVYHVTNGGACTWHEFASAICEIAGTTIEVEAISSDQFGAAAKRPRYSVLSNRRWINAGFTPLRSWRNALASCLNS